MSTSDDDSSASLTIINDESFDITDIYISESGFGTSDDLLSSDLVPTAQLIVTVDCGTYDVEIIDSTGTDCYITGYQLCASNDTWDLDDNFFEGCATSGRVSDHSGATHIKAPNASFLK